MHDTLIREVRETRRGVEDLILLGLGKDDDTKKELRQLKEGRQVVLAGLEESLKKVQEDLDALAALERKAAPDVTPKTSNVRNRSGATAASMPRPVALDEYLGDSS